MKAFIMAVGKHSATVAERLLRNSADIAWGQGAELEVKLPPSLAGSEVYLTSSEGRKIPPTWSRDTVKGFRLDSGTYSLWIDERELKRGIEVKKGVTRRVEVELREIRGGNHLITQRILSVEALGLLFAVIGAVISSWWSNPLGGLTAGVAMGSMAWGASSIHELLEEETEEVRRLVKLAGALVGFTVALVLMYSIASILERNLGSLPIDAATAGIFGAFLGMLLESRAPLSLIVPAQVEPKGILPSKSVLTRRELTYIGGFLVALLVGAALGFMIVGSQERTIARAALAALLMTALIGGATAVASYFGLRKISNLSNETRVSLSLALTLLSVCESLSRTLNVASILLPGVDVGKSEALLSNLGVPLLIAVAFGLLYLLFVDFPITPKLSVRSITRECPSEPRYFGSHLIVLSVLDDETRARSLSCTKWQETLIRRDLGKSDIHLLHVIGSQESYRDYLNLNSSSFRKTIRYVRDWVIAKSGSDLDLIVVIFDAECCSGKEAVESLGRTDLPLILLALLPPRSWKESEIERALEGLEDHPVILADPLLYVTPTSPIAEAMEEFESEVASSIGPILEIGGPGIESISGVDVSHVLSTLGGSTVVCCEPLHGFRGSLATVGRAVIPHVDDPEMRLKDATRASLSRTLMEIDYDREDAVERMSNTRLLMIVKGDRKAVIPQAVMTELKKVYRGTLIGVADISVDGMREIEVISLIAGLDRDLLPRLGQIGERDSHQMEDEYPDLDRVPVRGEEGDPFEEIIREVS